MKKLTIAALLMIMFAGAGMAQTHPKKSASKEKTEVKKDTTASAGTTTKHHKSVKHTK
jgi:hypothetical protein